MASTILCTEINKAITYPQTIEVSVPNNCGTISVVCDDSYTEQMVYEMPSIVIDIYIPVDGKDSLYKYRSISCTVNKNIPQSFPLTDIPETCTFYIQPNFDNYVFETHNEEIINSESDDYWETPTTIFPISLIWNDTNIVSGGSRGSGGGSFVPSQDQLDAMNSGITSELVEQITTNKNDITTIQETIGDINDVLEGVL